MTLYVTSPNFNVLIVIINFLLAKNHRKNILQRTIGRLIGGIIWEVEGRGSGSNGVAYHTDSPTQVGVFDLD